MHSYCHLIEFETCSFKFQFTRIAFIHLMITTEPSYLTKKGFLMRETCILCGKREVEKNQCAISNAISFSVFFFSFISK